MGIACQPTVEYWVFIYYCAKLLDFGDTIFIVLGKKTRQLSVLHLWHHASTLALFGFYLSAGIAGGSIAMLPLLNSLTHVVMYSHYLACSIFKIKHAWWKPGVTALQMGHHVVLMVYMVLNTIYGGSEFSVGVCIAGLLWGCSILGLFARFYLQSYLSKGPVFKKARS